MVGVVTAVLGGVVSAVQPSSKPMKISSIICFILLGGVMISLIAEQAKAKRSEQQAASATAAAKDLALRKTLQENQIETSQWRT